MNNKSKEFLHFSKQRISLAHLGELSGHTKPQDSPAHLPGGTHGFHVLGRKTKVYLKHTDILYSKMENAQIFQNQIEAFG